MDATTNTVLRASTPPFKPKITLVTSPSSPAPRSFHEDNMRTEIASMGHEGILKRFVEYANDPLDDTLKAAFHSYFLKFSTAYPNNYYLTYIVKSFHPLYILKRLAQYNEGIRSNLVSDKRAEKRRKTFINYIKELPKEGYNFTLQNLIVYTHNQIFTLKISPTDLTDDSS